LFFQSYSDNDLSLLSLLPGLLLGWNVLIGRTYPISLTFWKINNHIVLRSKSVGYGALWNSKSLSHTFSLSGAVAINRSSAAKSLSVYLSTYILAVRTGFSARWVTFLGEVFALLMSIHILVDNLCRAPH
jgi:hypothetical protein